MWFIIVSLSMLCSVSAENVINPVTIMYGNYSGKFRATIIFEYVPIKDVAGFLIIYKEGVDNFEYSVISDTLSRTYNNVLIENNLGTTKNFMYYMKLMKNDGVLCEKKFIFNLTYHEKINTYRHPCLNYQTCVIQLKLDWENQCQESGNKAVKFECQSLVLPVAAGAATVAAIISWGCACACARVCCVRRARRPASHTAPPPPPDATPTDEEYTYACPSEVVYAEIAMGRSHGERGGGWTQDDASPYAQIIGFLAKTNK